jgi:hypothetical protein
MSVCILQSSCLTILFVRHLSAVCFTKLQTNKPPLTVRYVLSPFPLHKLQLTAHSSQLTAHSSQPTAHSPQLTAHSSHITAHSSQLTAHSSQLTAHSSQPTAHSPQLTAHSPQLTAHSSQCWLLREGLRLERPLTVWRWNYFFYFSTPCI